MAKKLVRNYTFTASAKTVAINGSYPLNTLLLITNTTRNIIIYNFADPALGATRAYNSTTDITTFTLTYNTAPAMANGDALQIFVDEIINEVRFDPVLIDPVDKARVSEAQSLIDTDFEYGGQVTKWENLVMTNNRPFAFTTPNQLSNVISMSMSPGSRQVTVRLGSGSVPALGTPITVQDTYLLAANGNYVIESGSGTAQFIYTAKSPNPTNITDVFDPNKTAIFRGTLYTSASIGGTPVMTYVSSAITVTTTQPHGLTIGNEIAVTGVTATTNSPTGSHFVATVLSPTQFVYYVPTGSVPTGVLVTSSAAINTRPQGQILHRPFDGGALFTSNGGSANAQAIRQTRRYFRYQSGKGMQMSSGTILKPNLQLDVLTSSGTTVTVQTKEEHNIQPGTIITVSGANEAAYNGTFTVNNTLSFNTFTYTALTTPSSAIASGQFSLSVINWFGAINRLGIYDSQNGVFFEYDGQTLYAVRRNSTFQIAGRATVTLGSNTVTQTNSVYPTAFSRQLNPGDFIVIRGMSYKVTDIASDTSMTITPSYRGPNAQFTIISKTVDLKFPQSQWNLDKMDGTGPSGYNIDLARMQMFYIDYSWYGAGAVRWGLRAANGNIFYCHRLINNNTNTEAYLRSGNLPARYESATLVPTTYLSASFTSVATTLFVSSSAGFPVSGTLCIRDATKYEYITYEGTGSNSFTITRRAQPGVTTGLNLTMSANTNIASVPPLVTSSLQIGQRIIGPAFAEGAFISALSGSFVVTNFASTASNPIVIAAPMGTGSAQDFTYSVTAPIAVELAYPTFAPSLSHWGTSVIMDGKFDNDKSLIFTYGQTLTSSLPAGATRALLSIRVAPSVDNGIASGFGAREVLNRMQLQLQSLGVSISTVTGSIATNILVRANLNGTPSTATTWSNAVGNDASVVNSSLAQIADFANAGTTISGGETVAGFFVNTTDRLDLTTVRDLGNSILGGGGTAVNSQIYPDGPDILTITATNLSPIAISLVGRISWTEAQA
jgi:hypothetical protein